MPHTLKKSFYNKPSSYSNKLFFDVGSTLIRIQRESQKTVEEADFELPLLQPVRFFKKNLQPVTFQKEGFTKCQILK